MSKRSRVVEDDHEHSEPEHVEERVAKKSAGKAAQGGAVILFREIGLVVLFVLLLVS